MVFALLGAGLSLCWTPIENYQWVERHRLELETRPVDHRFLSGGDVYYSQDGRSLAQQLLAEHRSGGDAAEGFGTVTRGSGGGRVLWVRTDGSESSRLSGCRGCCAGSCAGCPGAWQHPGGTAEAS